MIYFIEIAKSYYWGSSHDDCYKHEDQYSFAKMSQGAVESLNDLEFVKTLHEHNLKVILNAENVLDAFNPDTADNDPVIIKGAVEYLKLLIKYKISEAKKANDIYNAYDLASLMHQKDEIKKELSDSKYKSAYLDKLEYLNQTRYQATDDLARYYESQSKYKIIEIELIKKIKKAKKLNDLFNIVETLDASLQAYKTSYGL